MRVNKSQPSAKSTPVKTLSSPPTPSMKTSLRSSSSWQSTSAAPTPSLSSPPLKKHQRRTFYARTSQLLTSSLTLKLVNDSALSLLRSRPIKQCAKTTQQSSRKTRMCQVVAAMLRSTRDWLVRTASAKSTLCVSIWATQLKSSSL